jgi:inner membrane protein
MATWVTHAIFALLVGSALHVILGTDPIASLAFVLLGAMLPDIDHPKSLVGTKVKVVGMLSKHRGFFHSLIGAVVITVIIELVLRALGIYNSQLPAFFLIGFLTHLLLDSTTVHGVRFFYPTNLKTRGKLKTGTTFEWIMTIIMALVLVWYWLI